MKFKAIISQEIQVSAKDEDTAVDLIFKNIPYVDRVCTDDCGCYEIKSFEDVRLLSLKKIK